jgi:uncharacterized protein
VKFFLLVFALSIPFWLVGATAGLQLLPGLPVAALMFVCPATAALICVFSESNGLMHVMGVPLPAPQFSVSAALGMSVAFFVSALGEELGWSGYALDPMQHRWNALGASIVLGLVWAAWHIVPFWQAHRSEAWIVWLYNNTDKSVFAATVCHASSNVSIFVPNYGSYYDPRFSGLITAFAAAIVTVVWGPRTLARYRNG